MKDLIFTVQHNKPVADGVHEIKLNTDQILPPIACGQFLHIEVPSKTAILRRPFGIFKSNEYSVTIVVARVGKGTESLCQVGIGTQLRAILPLGNGFSLEKEHKRIVLVGGSIGCVPLYGITKQYPDREFFAYLGFKNKKNVMYENEFAAVCKTTICTYDGSYGFDGYQVPALENDLANVRPDIILSCGSRSMTLALQKFAEKHNIPAYMSHEQRMACGVGACLGCTCKVKDDKGDARNKRVCMDGPVFNLKDIVL